MRPYEKGEGTEKKFIILIIIDNLKHECNEKKILRGRAMKIHKYHLRFIPEGLAEFRF
jgi:hypothetical protein